MDTELSFESISEGKVNLYEIIVLIKRFLSKNPQALYTLIIGTDSQEKGETKNGKKTIHAVTAIVVHQKGFGGKYFWKRTYVHNIHNLREKIYAETMLSLDLAKIFVPLLQKSLGDVDAHYALEIHVDVGEYGKTREMIKEVVGMVTGSGYIAKTKPYSYGASYVADKYT